MIALLLTLIGFIGYAAASAFTFGYISHHFNVARNGWDTPLPLVSALFWPITGFILLMQTVMVPLNAMGYAYSSNKLKRKKKRIAQQKQVRIELQAAEKELEQEFQALEVAEQQKVVRLQSSKEQMIDMARVLDDQLFDKANKHAR